MKKSILFLFIPLSMSYGFIFLPKDTTINGRMVRLIQTTDSSQTIIVYGYGHYYGDYIFTGKTQAAWDTLKIVAMGKLDTTLPYINSLGKWNGGLSHQLNSTFYLHSFYYYNSISPHGFMYGYEFWEEILVDSLMKIIQVGSSQLDNADSVPVLQLPPFGMEAGEIEDVYITYKNLNKPSFVIFTQSQRHAVRPKNQLRSFLVNGKFINMSEYKTLNHLSSNRIVTNVNSTQ